MGCSPPAAPPPPPNPLAIDQRFKELCHSEYQLPAIKTLRAGRTLWVYLPMEKPIFELKISEENEASPVPPPSKPPASPPPWSILYLKTEFREKTFFIEYDLIPSTKSAAGDGVSPEHTKEFADAESHLVEAVSRVYFDAKPGEEVDFVVFVIADIKTGIAVKETLYLEDLKRLSTESIPQEEFFQRFLQETWGKKSLVGDATGASLVAQGVSWGDFLSRQIENRIYFKYEKSDFPPGEDVEHEIMGQVAITVGVYNFTDFDSVKLHNLREKKTYDFRKDQLGTFKQ